MKEFIACLESKTCTLFDLINCLEKIKLYGDTFIIKVDGGRSKMQVMVMIVFYDSDHDLIRHESASLEEALMQALKDYVSVKQLD